MPHGAAAAAAAIANAIKATGAIVRVEQKDFEIILRKTEKPLVIIAQGGLFSTKYQYMTSYKGFAFFTKTVAPLLLPSSAEIIRAQKIWTPQ
ncbi:MAG TPA: hypothetical protein VF779_15415 [Pyrinomonadaceae bacterium]